MHYQPDSTGFKTYQQSPTKVLGHFHLYMVLQTNSFENRPLPPPPR